MREGSSKLRLETRDQRMAELCPGGHRSMAADAFLRRKHRGQHGEDKREGYEDSEEVQEVRNLTGKTMESSSGSGKHRGGRTRRKIIADLGWGRRPWRRFGAPPTRFSLTKRTAAPRRWSWYSLLWLSMTAAAGHRRGLGGGSRWRFFGEEKALRRKESGGVREERKTG
jgi:hypothetical protein